MAAIVVRLKPKTLANLNSVRYFSSSSSSSSSNDDSNNNNNNNSSYFADIKSRLRQSPQPHRRIPQNPPKPDFFASSSPPKETSLEEIRRQLAEFRNRSAPPSPTATPAPVSFQDLYKSTVTGDEEKRRSERLEFEGICESLKQFRDKNRGGGGAPPTFSLRNMNERLSRMQEKTGTGASAPLPKSIFGKELEVEDGTAPAEKKTDLWTEYTYEELGDKLRKLRMGKKSEKGVKGTGDVSVSSLLNEMNERLVKLRVQEEREADSKLGGAFKHLKDSLVKLKESQNQAKMPGQRHSILAHFAGFGTPQYLLSAPKEHLLGKYLHPDLMSSKDKMKLELQKVRDEFKMSESDCGSARVQVAQLTTKIKHLSSVLHKKDKHSSKGLQAMLQRRKKLMTYLRRTDWDSYCLVLSKLGLKDVGKLKSLT